MDRQRSARKDGYSCGSVRISRLNREDVPACARMEREYYSLPWTQCAFFDVLERGFADVHCLPP